MAIKIERTGDVHTNGIKVLVYGKAGIGKTKLLATTRRIIVLSCESGLLSLREDNLPYIKIKNVKDIYAAYDLITGRRGRRYRTVALDSISEIAEVVLADYKRNSKDPRMAYGEMAEEMAELIRMFRDLEGKNVVFTAKQKRINDDGVQKKIPSMPGQQMKDELPFFFDEVFYMTLGEDKNGKEIRVLKTDPGYDYEAKDRSGKLKRTELPNLDAIFRKIKKS